MDTLIFFYLRYWFCKSEVGFKNKTEKATNHIVVAEADVVVVSILVEVKVKYSGIDYSLHVLRKSLHLIVLIAVSFRN